MNMKEEVMKKITKMKMMNIQKPNIKLWKWKANLNMKEKKR